MSHTVMRMTAIALLPSEKHVSSCFVFTLLLLNFSKVFLYDSFLMSDNRNSKSGKHELKVFNMEIVF